MKRIQVRYCLWGACKCEVRKHPQQDMRDLGFNVIAGVAQSVGDQWWFTVEKLIEPLPEYITPMEYDFEYWHGDGTMIRT